MLMEQIAQGKNKASYRNSNTRIKIFEQDFKKSDILNEALNQARVEETGLRIPKLLKVCKTEGKWSIVTEYVEGVTLESLMEESPDQLENYMEQFVLLQKEILSKRSPLLTKLKDKMNRKISQSGLDATTRYDLHTRLNAMKDHVKVCHGDFNPSNVIVDKDGRLFVIDWSHATQGNGSADAARTYLLFELAGKHDWAELYLKMFCEMNDVARQYVYAWTPIIAASQLVKEKPKEQELLLRWVDVVDYD
ncbi:MAG: phosphotransferase [Ruminococcus sp.]|nr:phosphotransferase [Ruminococcus sp.]